MADFKRTKEYRELKRALEESLDARGLNGPVYADMVRRYLSFREMEAQADADIEANGLNVLDPKRGTMMANPAVATKLNASRQAAAIYRCLGFEDAAKRAASWDGDDDEL